MFGIAALPASAAVLVAVPFVSNSTTTTVFAINDNDVIAGTGHACCLEDPPTFDAIALEFFKRHKLITA